MRFPKAKQIISAAVMAMLSWQVFAQDRGPNINDRFPVKESGELSSPIVSPVGECAKAVHVSGFIAHATIRVFVNGSTPPAGIAHPYFADVDIPLAQPLKLGDKVTATQEVQGITSNPSVDPMVVGPYPSALNTPVVGPDLFSCGHIVPVNKLNPGTQVNVFRNGGPTPIGTADATQEWQPVGTQSLNSTDHVTAIQMACPNIPSKKITSLPSAPVGVHVSPSPPPAPAVEPYPVGADAVVLDGLFVGAEVQTFEDASPAGGGFAVASRNRAPVQPPVPSTAKVSATQKLCTTSPPSPGVPPSSTLNAPHILPPVCEGTHYVTVRDTYPNAIVVLFRNGAIAGMAGGVLGDLKISLGGGAAWSLGDELHVIQYVGNVISPQSSSMFANCAAQNVLTQHNDNSRSGASLVESQLTSANVKPATFGRLYTRTVDGDTVSQPLYMRGVRTDKGLKNMIFVTTSKNRIYAFDADDLDTDPSHGLLWQRTLCPSKPTGVCGETWSHLVGISSTPVIDANSQTLYAVARCSTEGVPGDEGPNLMYAINVADGSDRVKPVDMQATDPDHPSVKFDYHCQRNRPGLLLSNGVVYAGFGTFSCDAGCSSAPYHGWVLGYRASDLKQVAVFDTSPGNGQVGIWQTGNGLAAAADGSIYFETGNGPNSESLQDSFVKLKPTASRAGLAMANSFTPNNAATLSNGDTDLGSGGPMLLPRGRLIGGGKQGRYYVLDQTNMKLTQDSTPDALGFDGFQAFMNTYHNDKTKPSCPAAGGAAGCDPSFAGGTCFIDPIRYGNGELCGPNIHGGPIYWESNPAFGLIYEMPEKDFLKAFKYDFGTGKVTKSAVLVATGSLARPPTDGMPGGFSSLSANKRTNGIVWTSMPFGDGQWNPVPGRLAAFDASDLKQLWSDDDNVLFAKSVPPTIADGKVIRATAANQVIVYGLLKAGRTHQPLPPRGLEQLCHSIDEKYRNYGAEVGLLGEPTSDESSTDDQVGGKFRNYRRSIFGMSRTLASHMERSGRPTPSCSVPKGATTPIDSSIYWSAKSCAHVVQGQIRELWLQLGGVRSKLGYPIADETLSPDFLGRRSSFEHGEIWWYPDKGPYVYRQGKTDRIKVRRKD
jgi:hypothetical protein